jgi:hypothetical protein
MAQQLKMLAIYQNTDVGRDVDGPLCDSAAPRVGSCFAEDTLYRDDRPLTVEMFRNQLEELKMKDRHLTIDEILEG